MKGFYTTRNIVMRLTGLEVRVSKVSQHDPVSAGGTIFDPVPVKEESRMRDLEFAKFLPLEFHRNVLRFQIINDIVARPIADA